MLGACGDQTVEGMGSPERGAHDPVLFDTGTPIGDGFVVPAAKRNVAWDEVIRSTHASRAAAPR